MHIFRVLGHCLENESEKQTNKQTSKAPISILIFDLFMMSFIPIDFSNLIVIFFFFKKALNCSFFFKKILCK